MWRLVRLNSIASWLVFAAVGSFLTIAIGRDDGYHHCSWPVVVWITANYIFRVSSRHLRIIKRLPFTPISPNSKLPLKLRLTYDARVITSKWFITELPTNITFHSMHTTWWHTCGLSIRIWIINSLVVRMFIIWRVVMYSHTFFKLFCIIRLYYHIILGEVL